jgi:hypothetical protein
MSIKSNPQSNLIPLKNLVYFMLVALVIVGFADQLSAIESESLRPALQGVKKEVWSYMYIIKIAAVVVGSVYAVMKQSPMSFGVGAAIFAATQFFDTLIGDGAGALIGS